MTTPPPPSQLPLLHRELRWVMSLRWLAGAAILLADGLQHLAGPVYDRSLGIAGVGVGVLACNAVFTAIDRAIPHASHRRVLALTWSQIIVDLLALTVLVLLTGALRSPLLGLYVLHMIFTGLLLTRVQAYTSALAAAVFLGLGLTLTNSWPADSAGGLIILGWAAVLLGAVFLTDHVTRGLFGLEQERLDQQERIRSMQDRLATQERAMFQQEKLVAIGQLAAGVAHEVSNPLASMDGLLQLMERHPERQRPEAIAQLREQVERIGRTVRQLTVLSHPDLGEPELTTLPTLIDQTFQILAYDHRLRRVRLEREVPDDPCSIHVVPRAIQQALMNLVLNALDAMEDTPEPALTIRTRRDADWCVIDVIDNGHGVAEPDRERILEPFVTSKPVGKGTGLGLPISADLVRAQGGRLSFESSPGEGSTFSISVPCRSCAADAEPPDTTGDSP